jgi:hypothetical protein
LTKNQGETHDSILHDDFDDCRLYHRKCYSERCLRSGRCSGRQGQVPDALRFLSRGKWQGDGPTGKALAAAGQPAPRDFTIGDFVLDTDKDGKTGTDADLKNVISKGALVYGGSAMMAPIQGMSDADLDNLVAYIRSLKQ